MPNVERMSNLITRLESPYISVHQDRCVLVRNRNADCLRCAEACTSGCISFDGTRLTVSPDKCIGCGTCATVCPTCALEARNPTDDALAQQCMVLLAASSNESVSIACSNARLKEGLAKAAHVECLGRVEESLLCACAASGAKAVYLLHGDCERCAHKTGRASCEGVVDCERGLLKAWKAGMQVQLVQAGDAFTSPDDATSAKPALEPVEASQDQDHVVRVMQDGTQPHFTPERRERLLNSLATLGQPSDEQLFGRLWAHVEIDTEICKGCRMCTVFCPSGALARFDDADGVMGIEHRPGDCSACGTCAAICPTKAIRIVPGVFASQLFDGSVQRIRMEPRSAHRGTAHSVWHSMEGLMTTTQVYER